MADELIRITYPKRDPDLGRHRIDVVPQGRDALVVWHDQFGTTHMATFGRWAKRKSQNRIERALSEVLD